MEHRDVLTRNAMAEGEPEGSCMSSLEDRIEAVEQKAREDRIEREKAGKPRGLSSRDGRGPTPQCLHEWFRTT